MTKQLDQLLAATREVRAPEMLWPRIEHAMARRRGAWRIQAAAMFVGLLGSLLVHMALAGRQPDPSRQVLPALGGQVQAMRQLGLGDEPLLASPEGRVFLALSREAR